MSFDVSQLEAYIKANGKPIARKAVASAKTAGLLIANRSTLHGVKGDNQVPTFDVNADLQDGSVVGRNASGGTTFSDKVLKINRFKSQHNYRSDDLYGTYLSELLAIGQEPMGEQINPTIMDAIMERRAKKIGYEVEKLIWNGDKASATASLKLMDGILKQTATGTIAITVTGADLIAKMQSAYKQMPVEISGAEDFVIFIGEDTYNDYKQAIWDAGKYHADSVDTLAGFGAKVVAVSGLNGTSKMFMTSLSNLVFGVDKDSEMSEATLKWSIETEQWYMDFNFALGVLVVHADQVGVASVA